MQNYIFILDLYYLLGIKSREVISSMAMAKHVDFNKVLGKLNVLNMH